MDINITKDYLFLMRKSNLLKINLNTLELEVDEVDLNNKYADKSRELSL